MYVYRLSSADKVPAVQTALAAVGVEARRMPQRADSVGPSDSSELDVFHSADEADRILRIVLDADSNAVCIF